MKKSNYKWVVLAIVCLAIFSPNYAQYQLAPIAPQLMTTYNLSMTQFSSVFSAPMIPAIFLSLVAGLLVDKFGVKRVISIGLIITAIGICLRVTATDYTTLLIYMILAGVGATFLNSNGAKIMGNYFEPEKISMAMSVFLASATLAMTLGMATTGLYPSIRIAFICAGIISVIGAVLWIVFVKDPKVEEDGIPKAPASIKESLKIVTKNKTIWIVGFCLMGVLACNVAISSFLPTALVGRAIDPVTAGFYASIMTLGSLVGCLTSPIIVSKVGKMKPVMLVLGVIATVGGALFWSAPEGIMLGAGLFVFGAALSGLMPLLMSIPIQLPEIGPEYAGTAGGFTGTLQLLGAVVIPTYIITPIAGPNMNVFFILAGVCMAVTSVLVLFLPELMKK
ncbi:MFS transporter [Acetobacterium wieringae]|uniref:Lysosomal dipeptide transporter MFSD1 n=1 Tax=Acetobacterium wieringae TaxID=52694 RepID=A0ABY6HIH0_9FIRM|nr:MFS transporter [Acetobacterium wieringae]UYO64343.1 MFS transporter [Acetobacterium wieringae]VUZ27111.1 Uncharacterised protein [Acetobacterium wieringae]